VCVHYLEITVFTPAINIGVLTSIIIQVHIHTRLLINKCLPLGNTKLLRNYQGYYLQVKCYNDSFVRLRINI
jgi:hypothetical protein